MDSWKGFKTPFFKVVVEPRKVPWFLQTHKSKEVEEQFPLYRCIGHHELSPKDFVPSAKSLFEAEHEAIIALMKLASKRDNLVDSADYILAPLVKNRSAMSTDTIIYYLVLP